MSLLSSNRAVALIACFLVSRFSFICAANVQADEHPGFVFISQELKLNYQPEAVFFLIEIGAEVRRIDATVVDLTPQAAAAQTDTEPTGVKRLAAGVQCDILPGVTSLDYSVVAVGKSNQFEVIPSQRLEIDLADTKMYSIDALRTEMEAQNKVLTSYALQIKTQDESLRRLREDAEVIGNFGRLMEVSDEIERSKMLSEEAENDSENLQRFVRLASSVPAPKNGPAREGQLTRQIAELAEAAKNAEASEISRRSGMEGALQQQLAIVESTRFDDIDALKGQLEILKSERAKLEGATGPVPVEPQDITPLPVSPETNY